MEYRTSPFFFGRPSYSSKLDILFKRPRAGHESRDVAFLQSSSKSKYPSKADYTLADSYLAIVKFLI